MVRHTSSRPARRGGFTLLELVIIMAILVALAGLIIGKLDLFQSKSEKAVAASNMNDLLRFLQTYRSQSQLYPDRWDSLLDSTGTALAVPGAPGTTPGLDPGLVGGPPTGSPQKLALMTAALTDGEVRSLTRVGISTVLFHNGATTLPFGNGYVTPTPITNTLKLATINGASTQGQSIINSIYPTPVGTPVVPAGKQLVVLGLGRYCTIVGSSTQSAILNEAPVYPYEPAQYYERFLAVFEVNGSGGRARLVAVLGADGDLAAAELADFKAQ